MFQTKTNKKHISMGKLLSIFANKRRLGIVDVLKKHEHASVSFLAEKIGLSLHATSKHLQLLEQAGIVTHVEDGLFRLYILVPPKNKLTRYIISQV